MDNRRKIYLSGKITGTANLNKHKFEAAEKLLAGLGYNILNPHKLPDNHDKSWESYMKVCVEHLVYVDYVFVLDDWKYSKGAIREVMIAKWLNIKVHEIETFQELDIPFLLKIKLLLNLI